MNGLGDVANRWETPGDVLEAIDQNRLIFGRAQPLRLGPLVRALLRKFASSLGIRAAD